MKKKTNSEFLIELNNVANDILPLEKYCGMQTKMKFKCLKCNYIWISNPTNIIHKNHGCPNCAGNIKKTNEEFLNELYKLRKDVLPIEKYKSGREKMLCKCLKCNNEWYITPSKLLKGSGCPSCANKIRCKGRFKLSEEDFLDKIDNYNLELIGNYNGLHCSTTFKCNKCGYIFNTTPRYILKGTKCRSCYIKSITKTHSQFMNEIKEINPNILILDTYKNSSTYIKYKCTICGNVHRSLPDNLLRGYGCPSCAASKGEKKCKKYLQDHNLNFISQYEFNDLIGINGGKLRFDFGVIDKNNKLQLIEYDGIFHYEQQYDNDGYETLKIHDKLKNEYCKLHKIKLLRIPYYDFDKIEELLDKTFKIND